MLHASSQIDLSNSADSEGGTRIDAGAQSRANLDLVRSGDREQWEQLLSRMERRCLALAWRILNDSHLAADAVQDGFLKAYLARQSLRSSEDFERWLLATIANAARDLERSRSRRPEIGVEEHAQHAAPEPRAGADDDERLRWALAQLDEQSRVTFLLVHQEGFSYEAVSEAFGWPAGTVRSKLHRARLKLRELLKKREA
jgi:RNA polymerase sigma-70 factor, ECF subfamily